MLPREYPPWQTVYYHFRKWRIDGRLRRAHDRLRDAVRQAEGRERDPSATVVDSQVVKSTPVGGPERGYDGAKRLAVHSTDLPDRDGGRRLLGGGQELPRMQLLCADGAYTGGFREWLRRQLGWRMEVPHHRDQQLWRYELEDKPSGFLRFCLAVGSWRGLSRVAGSVATPEQGLRAATGDGGDHDIRRYESAYAATIGTCGVKIFYQVNARDSPFTKLPLRGCLRSPHWATELPLGAVHAASSRLFIGVWGILLAALGRVRHPFSDTL